MERQVKSKCHIPSHFLRSSSMQSTLKKGTIRDRGNNRFPLECRLFVEKKSFYERNIYAENIYNQTIPYSNKTLVYLRLPFFFFIEKICH